jgi:hypothetical protein
MQRGTVELASIVGRRNGIMGHAGHVARRSWQAVPEGSGPADPRRLRGVGERQLHGRRVVVGMEMDSGGNQARGRNTRLRDQNRMRHMWPDGRRNGEYIREHTTHRVIETPLESPMTGIAVQRAISKTSSELHSSLELVLKQHNSRPGLKLDRTGSREGDRRARQGHSRVIAVK